MTESTAEQIIPRAEQAIWFGPNRMLIRARALQTNGGFGLVETWAPAGSAPPLHLHTREEESFFILEGNLRVMCGDEQSQVGPGDFVVLPRGVPHAFRVQDGGAHMLTLLTPGGGEGFFEAAGAPARGPGLPPPQAPDVAALREAGTAFGIEILGAPMSA